MPIGTEFFTFPAGGAAAEDASSIQGTVSLQADSNPVIVIGIAWETPGNPTTEVDSVTLGGEAASFVHREAAASSPTGFHNVVEVYGVVDTAVNQIAGDHILYVSFSNPGSGTTAKVYVWVGYDGDPADPYSVFGDSSTETSLSIAFTPLPTSTLLAIANHQQGIGSWGEPEGFTQVNRTDYLPGDRVDFWAGQAQGINPVPAVITPGSHTYTRLSGVVIVLNKKEVFKKGIGFLVPLRKRIGFAK